MRTFSKLRDTRTLVSGSSYLPAKVNQFYGSRLTGTTITTETNAIALTKCDPGPPSSEEQERRTGGCPRMRVRTFHAASARCRPRPKKLKGVDCRLSRLEAMCAQVATDLPCAPVRSIPDRRGGIRRRGDPSCTHRRRLRSVAGSERVTLAKNPAMNRRVFQSLRFLRCKSCALGCRARQCTSHQRPS